MSIHGGTQARSTGSRVRDIALTSDNCEANRYRRVAKIPAPVMKLIGIKVPARSHGYLLGRFRAACARHGLTSAEALDYLLDLLEQDETKRDRLAGDPLTVSVAK